MTCLWCAGDLSSGPVTVQWLNFTLSATPAAIKKQLLKSAWIGGPVKTLI